MPPPSGGPVDHSARQHRAPQVLDGLVAVSPAPIAAWSVTTVRASLAFRPLQAQAAGGAARLVADWPSDPAPSGLGRSVIAAGNCPSAGRGHFCIVRFEPFGNNRPINIQG